jgi:hypothetical protein
MLAKIPKIMKASGFRWFSNKVIHEDILGNHVRLGGECERAKLIVDNAFGAFKDPERFNI